MRKGDRLQIKKKKLGINIGININYYAKIVVSILQDYEGNPQFIIKIVYSFVVDIKIITPEYFRLLFFRHHQGRMMSEK